MGSHYRVTAAYPPETALSPFPEKLFPLLSRFTGSRALTIQADVIEAAFEATVMQFFTFAASPAAFYGGRSQ
jgi:hypothetical protein